MFRFPLKTSSVMHLCKFVTVDCFKTDTIVPAIFDRFIASAIVLNRIDRWLMRPWYSVGRRPTGCLRKAKLSERGTKCRGKENGKGRNFYLVTCLIWTATAGDGSEQLPETEQRWWTVANSKKTSSLFQAFRQTRSRGKFKRFKSFRESNIGSTEGPKLESCLLRKNTKHNIARRNNIHEILTTATTLSQNCDLLDAYNGDYS